ncbi:MAG: TIGR01459 family HAD-type hydrolase [Pseudomonadota bacterium]
MVDTRLIAGLREIAGDYDGLLCDAWGVIHNGQTLYPGVEEALTNFRQQQGPVVVLTNAPRPSHLIPAQLDRIGLSRGAYDLVVTSGDATHQVIKDLADKPFFRIGPAKDDAMFEALSIQFTSSDEAEAIFCSGVNDDFTETPEDYRGMLTSLAERGLPMVCANPDIVVKFGDKIIYCAGAIGQLYEELGGKVLLGGKPFGPIYDLARARIKDETGKSPKRFLVIGDGIDTDIRGANNQNYDCLFIADGIFAEEARDQGQLSAAKLASALDARGVHAAYGLDSLVW